MNGFFSPGWFNNAYILGNTPLSYVCAGIAFAVSLLLLHIAKNMGLERLRVLAGKTETGLDDLAVELLERISQFEYYLAALFAASRYLYRAPAFDRPLNIIVLLIFTFRAVMIIQGLVSYWIEKGVASRGLSQDATDSVLGGVRVIIKALIWVAAGLFVMDNLGINISTVLAGLGIGGVAVALAAQAILGDLFNFFVILLDRPFKTGDFIVFEDISGTIEHVGLKSTKIRSLSGELIVISNSKLLSSNLHNYNQMTRRRVAFKLGVIYQTTPEKLRSVPGIIKKAVLSSPSTSLERCNLAACADSSLDFETVYYVENRDYTLYANTHEAIILKIIEGFLAAGIEFAYPTRTLFMVKQDS